jgi:hypothetical protein
MKRLAILFAAFALVSGCVTLTPGSGGPSHI